MFFAMTTLGWTMYRLPNSFTLVEIVIVMGLLGIIATIAVPYYVKSREAAQRSVCISNLKQIEKSKVLWSLDGNVVPAGVDVPMIGANALVPDYIRREPKCPTDGSSYTTGTVDQTASCNSGDASHILP